MDGPCRARGQSGGWVVASNQLVDELRVEMTRLRSALAYWLPHETMVADDEVVLGTKVPGRLSEISVDLGSRVRKGRQG